MANTARDLIKCRISNDPGTTGSFILDTAFTNSLLPAAADDGLKFKLNITENGVGTEIRRNCTYTHSTTTFSRGTMVRSTGTADADLNFTDAAIVSVVPSAEDYLTAERVLASASAPTLVSGSGSDARTANSAAIQAMLAVGGNMALPAGKFYVNENVLSALAPGVLRGAGKNGGGYYFATTNAGSLAEQSAGTTLAVISQTGWILGVDTPGFCVENVHFQNESAVNGAGVATAGGCIRIGSLLATTGLASSDASGCVIDKCSFYGGWVNIDHYAADTYTITNNTVTNFADAGIQINNSYKPGAANVSDFGDPYIAGNQITSGVFSAGKTGVRVKSGGGIKLLGNKINGNGLQSATYYLKYGINFVPLNTTNSGICQITGNSIEGITGSGGACINVDFAAGTSANWLLMNIVSNEMHAQSSGSGIKIKGNASGAFAGVYTIAGNIFNTCTTDAGITLEACTGTVIKSDNIFNRMNNGETAIRVDGDVAGCDIEAPMCLSDTLVAGDSIAIVKTTAASSVSGANYIKNRYPNRCATAVLFPSKVDDARNAFKLIPGGEVSFSACVVEATLEGNMTGIGAILYRGTRVLAVRADGRCMMAAPNNLSALAIPLADQVVIAGTAVAAGSLVSSGDGVNESVVSVCSGAESATPGINVEWNNFSTSAVFLRVWHTSGSASGSTNGFAGTLTITVAGTLAGLYRYYV